MYVVNICSHTLVSDFGREKNTPQWIVDWIMQTVYNKCLVSFLDIKPT